LESEFGLVFLKTALTCKDSSKRNLLFVLSEHKVTETAYEEKIWPQIFDYLFEKFKNDKSFLWDFLTSVNETGNTFLQCYINNNLLSHQYELQDTFIKTFSLLIHNPDITTTTKILIKNSNIISCLLTKYDTFN
jgi:hypothetical protein